MTGVRSQETGDKQSLDDPAVLLLEPGEKEVRRKVIRFRVGGLVGSESDQVRQMVYSVDENLSVEQVLGGLSDESVGLGVEDGKGGFDRRRSRQMGWEEGLDR